MSTAPQRERSEESGASDAALVKYRETLVDLEQKAEADYDRLIVALSGGGLGVSFAFVERFVGDAPADLFENAGIQNLAADRHPFAHVMEQLPVYRDANCRAGLREHWVRLGKEAVIRPEFLDTEVFDVHKPELF